jgi:hypothetical protein
MILWRSPGIPNLTTDPHGQNGLNRYESMQEDTQEALEIKLKKAEIPYESGNNQSYSLIHPCLSVVILKSELLGI